MPQTMARVLRTVLVIWGVLAGITQSQDGPSWSFSYNDYWSSWSSCQDCGDDWGNSTIHLVSGVPAVIDVYFLDNPLPCFWKVTAPAHNIIEVNVLSTTDNTPRIFVYPDVEGAADNVSTLFVVEPGEVGILYANVSQIAIKTDTSYDTHYKNSYAIQLTAFAEQECEPDFFQCLSQRCVTAASQCDGIVDCQCHEDEYGCGLNCSGTDQYLCPLVSEECISSDLVCDGHGDCPGFFDELDCGRCGDPYLNLSLTPAINITQPIDSSVDCLWFVTASDPTLRLQVEILSLPLVEYRYSMLYFTPIHVAQLSFGYGYDPSDNLTVVRTLTDSTHPGVITFNSSAIWIVLAIQPHGLLKTENQIDIEFTVSEYSNKDCDAEEFSCASGLLCINESKLCDGIADCPEFDDEIDCGCGANKFRCRRDTECVDASMLCDGQLDCSDGSDEDNCEPCGDTVIDVSSGPYLLQSLGYPDRYPINLQCTWHVYTEPDYDVMVVFLDFWTEDAFDYLHISDEAESSLYSISGLRHPRRVSSLSEDMWLTFQSDYSITYPGFEIRLEKVEIASCPEGEVACNGTTLLICILETDLCNSRRDCPGGTDEVYCSGICGPTFFDLETDATLLSPWYELGAYPESTKCLWYVRDNKRRRIQLDIHDFQTESYYDPLEIGVGNESDWGFVTRLSGSAKMSSILLQSQEIWLSFYSDIVITDKGFNITLRSVDQDGDTSCSGLCSLHTNAQMCLHPYAYCDGVVDCVDGTDEFNCVNVTCGMDQYLCQGKQRCIQYEAICDGHVDCSLFRDDEENCEYHGRPVGCDSLMVGDLLYVECKQGWNVTTVHNLVQITHSLELSGGNIKILEGGLFKRLENLRTLSLRNNNISRIELNAFTGLMNITSLDISENNIHVLTPGVFSELTMLLELAIRSVPVQLISVNAFAGLTHLQKLVLMRGNGVANTDSSSYEQATEVEDGALRDLRSLQTVYVDDHRLCCVFRPVLLSGHDCINIQLQLPLFNCGRLMPNTVLQAFMWILGCSALIGNLVVIAWRIREDSGKGSKYVHSFLVLNLAMSDFLMGVYMVTIATVDAIKKEEYYLTATEWRNSALCKAAGVMSVLSSEASVFFITLISVDRYLCIVHPFSRVRLQERSVWVSTISIWIASLAASLVPTILVSSDSDVYGLSDVCIGLPLLTRPVSYTFHETDVGSSLGNDTYLVPRPVGSRPTWSYSIVLFLGVNFLCFLAIAVCYVSIFVKIKRSVRRVRQHSHRDEEIKMAFKMAVIVGSDCLCWMPVIILGILSQTSAIQIEPEVYAWLVVFVLPINSSLNPYLYTIVTALSRRRQANSTSSAMRSRSQKPDLSLNLGVPMERRADSGCWTITTPTATPTATPKDTPSATPKDTPSTTPTNSIYLGHFDHM